MELFALFISLLLINNVVLSKFLAVCPLLGVIFVAGVITWLLYYYVLVPLNIAYMDLITFILVIASLVQFVEMFLKKTSPAIYKAMGVYLPLITTNCAVLGVALDNITAGYNFVEAMVAGLAVPLGFTLVIYIFATIRERLELATTPEGFKGVPIALITAAIMACAINGLTGLV